MAELAAFSESELRQEVHLSLGHAKLLFLSLAPLWRPGCTRPLSRPRLPTADASPAPGRRSSKKRRARKAKA